MKKENKVLLYLKKNGVYLVLAFCILAVGLTVMLVLTSHNETVPTVSEGNGSDIEQVIPDATPSDPVITDPVPPEDTAVVFCLPVDNPTSVNEYSDTMVFNPTLGRYSAHKATDFFAEEGTEVFAAFGGTVEKVENTLLTGYTVTIDHGNGLKTVYNSLADGDRVSVGQKVEKGQLIGEVSCTNRQESSGGAHLHFEVLENGVNIDPSAYLETIK